MNVSRQLINSKINGAQEDCYNIIHLADMLRVYVGITECKDKELETVEIFMEIFTQKCKELKTKLNEIEFDFLDFC